MLPSEAREACRLLRELQAEELVGTYAWRLCHHAIEFYSREAGEC